MPEARFQSLSLDDRREALEVAAAQTGRRVQLLEKDVWVVGTLRAMVNGPEGEFLTFKGGTSLSKAYDVIDRFSEDLDMTYDIRKIAPDLTEGDESEPLPPNRSQQKRWTEQIKNRLDEWVGSRASPAVEARLTEVGLPVRVRPENEKMFVEYEPLFADDRYVNPHVLVEFGARSTGEPRREFPITCDAAPSLPDVEFPAARVWVMSAERTFWEKATAMHVYCLQRRLRGDRMSRHWYDLVRLDAAGFADKAFLDRNIAVSVARHKSAFFRENDAEKNPIDYRTAVEGSLELVPSGSAYLALAEDYGKMLDAGMLFGGESFENLMESCAAIAEKANRISSSDVPSAD